MKHRDTRIIALHLGASTQYRLITVAIPPRQSNLSGFGKWEESDRKNGGRKF